MQHIDLEDMRVFALTDCEPAPAPCAHSFPDAVLADQPQVVARWLADGMFRTRFGPFLLRGRDGDVLVDCGVGPGDVAYFPGMRGNLPQALALAGSSLAQVTEVVFTHLHVDHVGWAGFLPNARFHVAEQEWAHWSGLGEKAGLPHHTQAVARCIMPLAAAGRLHAVRTEGQILPGIALHAATGHTPGHHVVLVRDRLLIAGDTWHNPAQVEVPGWCHRADMDKPVAVATRMRLAEAAHRNAWLVAAGHFTRENAFGRIEAREGGHAFVPDAPPARA
jgi:glyoxylase-like metal-dependent hydrolase (beta-lactamase superfamily II)